MIYCGNIHVGRTLLIVIVVVLFVFFFFQAEDGIRDLVRSRGLGDVYKRQADVFSTAGIAGLLGGFGFAGAIGLELTGLMPVALSLIHI